MRQRVRTRKDQGAAKPVFRLADIDVEEVSVVDRAANQRKFMVIKAEAGAPVVPDGAGAHTTEDGVDKAVWTTAYINSLPDSSFLYVESGGTKDAEGKTTPRSLRHFPVKDKNGNVDLPHLRNALSRIPQSSLGQDVKDKATAAAQRMLSAAEKADPPPSPEPPPENVPPGPQTEPEIRLSPEAKAELQKRIQVATDRLKAIGALLEKATVIQGLVEIPAEVIAKVAELVTGIAEGDTLAKAEHVVVKGLPQFSSSRLGALRAAHEAIGQILENVTPKPADPPADPPAPEPPSATGELEKMIAALDAKVAKGLSGLVSLVGKQGDAIAKQAQRIDKVDRGITPPNGEEPEGSPAPVVKNDDGEWPMDMANPDWAKGLPT